MGGAAAVTEAAASCGTGSAAAAAGTASSAAATVAIVMLRRRRMLRCRLFPYGGKGAGVIAGILSPFSVRGRGTRAWGSGPSTRLGWGVVQVLLPWDLEALRP
ncbi:hypothetical protein GCM10009612_11220 [Streptomyces beijiangensis]